MTIPVIASPSQRSLTPLDDLQHYLGADAQQVHHHPDLADRWALIDQGLLVDLHIGRWRGETRMTLEDLGLDGLDRPDYLHNLAQLTVLGRKFLLPKEVLHQAKGAEERGRRLVERYSFHLKLGRFMPFTSYQAWKAENDQARAAYFQHRDQLQENYATYHQQVLDAYRRIAAENYALMAQRQIPLEISQQAFVDRYVERLRQAIPDQEFIYNSFCWEVSLDFVPLPATLEADLLRREEVSRQRRLSREQEKLMQQMNTDLAQHLRQQKTEQIDGLVGHLRRQLLERVYEVTGSISDRVRQTQTLSGSQVRSLRQLIGQVEQMNFLGDAEVDQHLQALEQLVAERAHAAPAIDQVHLLSGLSQLNESIKEEVKALLSRRGIRAQMTLDDRGQETVFGRRVSRLRQDLADASVPTDVTAQRLERQLRAA